MLNVELVPILQTAIGPAILISGIGLLLLTMTNRLGRSIDRARALTSHSAENSPRQQGQLSILWRRSSTLRWAILLGSSSALCAAFLIIGLFVGALLKIEFAWAISGLFVLCQALLICSIALFIHDVNQSLEALRIEMQQKSSSNK